MKRILSFILAALLLTSSFVSCGQNPDPETKAGETEVSETKAPEAETSISETDIAETDTPTYDTSLVTENGIAKAHIVLFDGASSFEQTAAEELAVHIKLVSGADVAVTNTPLSDSLPIVIATPDSLPELETMFPEDLARLRVLSEKAEDGSTRNWSSDGFAIRTHEGKIYIFGATAIGAMNGVYDFIEENLDVIWIGIHDEDIIYDEMPTIRVMKTDYSEKSPFSVADRGNGNLAAIRNKKYTTAYPYGSDANVKSLLLSSPIYDPNETEYWDTDGLGNHVSPESSKQINFWSEKAAEAIGASVIAQLDSFSDDERPVYYNVCMEDIYDPCVYPEIAEPFEYAPGQFVEATDAAYLSTVYFTFINRVARVVKEKYPDIYINTLAYMWAIQSPKCEIDENVSVWFCPYYEDYTKDSFAVTLAQTDSSDAVIEAKAFENWLNDHPDTVMMIYNYYFSNPVLGWYERPIWYRLASDFRYYAENGVIGMTACLFPNDGSTTLYRWQKAIRTTGGNPEGFNYLFTYGDGWTMNLLTLWIYYKLLWNPYEDVDALIVKFCDKVYGDASPYMQEYYNLLTVSWQAGAEYTASQFNAAIALSKDADYYYEYFFDFDLEDGTFYLDAVKDVLTKAYEAADDRAKEFIRWQYEVYQDWTRYLE